MCEVVGVGMNNNPKMMVLLMINTDIPLTNMHAVP